ncbi:R3H domain-containing nucleic acid-binding protein [Bifidobacterium sp. H6bp22N]|uniref:Jag family protein n=1 Tax=Bifidobacterium polysaccharolyticum TaxID=2750967 RepID=UPI0028BEDD31|nr:R3H domain-containing nucleic acid-binding protein [Bifidobacterium sp. H6bp22N]MDT7508063.1 R3H domain-containing nucleic acid-binding protein [Bifidobacterium sp. H6bp22N]
MSQSLDQGKTIEQLNEEADVAADYLEGLLDIADYEGDIEMGVRNHRPTVQIVADDDTDIKHLIGKDGEVVDALQQLTRLAVQQKIGERSHLIVDVDGFLRRKREHLREQALDVIDEVRETGDPVNMKPMNSFERKIVHDMVREEGLKSRSHGEEPHRYVTVYLKAKSEDEDLPDDVEDEPVGYDDPLDVDETDQVVDSANYEADDDPADADRE